MPRPKKYDIPEDMTFRDITKNLEIPWSGNITRIYRSAIKNFIRGAFVLHEIKKLEKKNVYTKSEIDNIVADMLSEKIMSGTLFEYVRDFVL